MIGSKHVERLLTKATQDEYVLDRMLPDDCAPMEIFGFHAQQAVEKLLKALLTALGVNYPRSIESSSCWILFVLSAWRCRKYLTNYDI